MARLRSILKELTSSEADEIDALFNCPSSDHIVTTRFRFPIRLCTLHCLKDGGWLTDDIINYYIELLRENSSGYGYSTSDYYFFQTYFYIKLRDQEGNFCFENVENWNKNIDFCSFKKLFVPMHVNGNHWALAVIDIGSKKIFYVDSLASQKTFKGMEVLIMWWSRVSQQMNKADAFDKFDLVTLKCPQQDNGDDCGIFLLTFMHIMYLNEDINLMDSSMVHYMRRKIALAIVREILLVILQNAYHAR